MKRRFAKGPTAAALLLGLLLFAARGSRGRAWLSDLFFSLGSGALLVGLVRLLGNLRMFASLAWGTGLLKRLFRGEARTGRQESEDYARYRNGKSGHEDAPWLLLAAAVLMILSGAAAALA